MELAPEQQVERVIQDVALFQLNLQRKKAGLYEQTWDELTDVIKEIYLKWARQILSHPDILIRDDDQSLPEDEGINSYRIGFHCGMLKLQQEKGWFKVIRVEG